MIKNLYSSPIYTSNSSKELLDEVRSFISKISIPSEIRANSTKGGFQSDSKIFEYNDKSIINLKRFIATEVAKYWPHIYEALTGQKSESNVPAFDLWGWVTSLNAGGFNSPHIHPRSTISGVFYLQTPFEIIKNVDNNFSGWIGSMDPRSNSQIWPLSSHLNYFFVPPVEGSLVLFPSYLQHFVPPFNAKDERIAIAFNLRHKTTQLLK